MSGLELRGHASQTSCRVDLAMPPVACVEYQSTLNAKPSDEENVAIGHASMIGVCASWTRGADGCTVQRRISPNWTDWLVWAQIGSVFTWFVTP